MREFEKVVLEEISVLEDELKRIQEKRKVVEAKINGLRMFLSASEFKEVTLSLPEAPMPGPVQSVSPEMPQLPALRRGVRIMRRVTSDASDAPKLTIKDRVLEASLKVLEDGQPRHTSSLLVEFEKAGIEVGGTNKLATVSSILSRDGRFKANRTIGWTLTKKESPAANEAFDLQPTP